MANDKPTQQQQKDPQSGRISGENVKVRDAVDPTGRSSFGSGSERNAQEQTTERGAQKRGAQQGREELPQEKYPPQAGKEKRDTALDSKETKRPQSGKY